MNIEYLYEIWVRLERGYSIRRIAGELGIDRKTVGIYAQPIRELGIASGTSYARAIELLAGCQNPNNKAKPGQEVLTAYTEEIRDLLMGSSKDQRKPMKGTTAWAVIQEKYGLGNLTSYESFKRFVRERGLKEGRPTSVPRIEVAWGEEVQIDYGKMGIWSVAGKQRVIYAYIAILSASRLPFILFTTSQDQVSFAQATVAMLRYYGGAPVRFNLDNLKAGVLSPDAYDPILNRTFAELCDHYGVLADPARIRSPKDKGKVERFVQVAREAWKLLTYLHPDDDLDTLNELAKAWCFNEYGQKKHGTTGWKPTGAFEGHEKAALKALPIDPFEVARWSTAKVQPDQFIAVRGKLYGVPAPYIGKTVAVRTTESFVEIFFEYKTIRRYAIPEGERVFLEEDFPAYAVPFKRGAFADWLIRRGQELSPQAGRYIALMVESGGNLSFRRAQSCLDIMEKERTLPGFSHVLGLAIAGRIFHPNQLKTLFAAEAAQNLIPFPVSERGRAMGRDADYYSGP